ncbi:uncharacterized protein LOC126717045 isoform X3 [Quercus robur]|uniref:uncharacterized protein LOC126717045 isoform X3 n=1 Tax=Quercus robur TaxID=38942 RepID=UPI0021612C67|nr:uncharacterized protein LOC126717045 isoform X3 [Quercus robur]
MASGELATSGTDEKHETDHKEGEDMRVLPVHYSNNYFSLVPSEVMPIKITFKVPPGVTPRAILITGVTVVGDENLSAKSSHSLAEAMPKDARYCDNNLYGAIDIYLKILSNYSRSEIIEREWIDPFEKPECEAFDIFVNEVLCVGKGCPYSCVKRAPHAFSFASTGSARVSSQGHGEDYQVQLAVGQCPRSCIHYVTPSQRIILEELLDSILSMPYNSSAEAELLYSLLVKAKFENNRYQKPKKQPKTSTQHVDWF